MAKKSGNDISDFNMEVRLRGVEAYEIEVLIPISGSNGFQSCVSGSLGHSSVFHWLTIQANGNVGKRERLLQRKSTYHKPVAPIQRNKTTILLHK